VRGSEVKGRNVGVRRTWKRRGIGGNFWGTYRVGRWEFTREIPSGTM